jgi:hypothetical protein
MKMTNFQVRKTYFSLISEAQLLMTEALSIESNYKK